MTPSSSADRFRPGAVLAEAVVSLTILSVAIVPLLGGIRHALRVRADSSRLEAAACIADRELQLATRRSPGRTEGNDDRYSWSVSVEQRPEGLWRASVEVRWLQEGIQQAFEMERLFLMGVDDE